MYDIADGKKSVQDVGQRQIHACRRISFRAPQNWGRGDFLLAYFLLASHEAIFSTQLWIILLVQSGKETMQPERFLQNYIIIIIIIIRNAILAMSVHEILL